MSDLDIKSETVDKAIDKLVKPVYDDVAKPAINTGKEILSFCSKFIVSGIKPYMYSKIKECEYKIKEIDRQLEEKYNNIIDENKTEPRTNILGPAVDVLKYNLEEEHIKEMFINLIGNDLDKTKQSRVLPAYIDIVKQLSYDDANFLKYFKDNQLSLEPIMELQINSPDGGFLNPSNDIVLINNNDLQIVPSIIIDNLSRLKIIEINFEKHFYNSSIYDNAFQKFKEQSCLGMISNSYEKLDFSKGLIRLTDFGSNFIDICLS